MAVSVAKTAKAPVLLKKNDITEASHAGRKPAVLERLIFCFSSDSPVIVKAQLVRRRFILFMFTSKVAGLLITISQIRVKVKHGMFLTFSLSFPTKSCLFLPNKTW